ncbi:MAG TPA: HemK2/MTQ2 family protein methyltransferase [Thermoleophilaceae bacterium]|nr:HemK2/MTQ2 family protein methyltransferase [Thermoleophilaceae bacterium]
MRLVTLPGVFTPPSDSWLLVEEVRRAELAQDATVLDVFTGSGVLAIAAALAGARQATAVDISRRAVATVRINARLNGVRVRALRGDVFAPVAGRRFDLILANPPYVPSASDAVPARGAQRAWEAGRDGRALLDRFCPHVGKHLNPGGRVLIVQSALSGEEATLAALAGAGLEPEVVARHRGALGPIVSARAPLLEERGLLAPGEREEDLLVIEGRA